MKNENGEDKRSSPELKLMYFTENLERISNDLQVLVEELRKSLQEQSREGKKS